MEKKEILARLNRIRDGIETDRFTLENVSSLINDIHENENDVHDWVYNKSNDGYEYVECSACGKKKAID